MSAQRDEHVYITLLLNDTYLPGALVLAHSLRNAGTSKKLAVLVTLDSVSSEVITELKSVFDYVIPVPRIRNENPANLYLMNRPDLQSAFTKLNLWRQTQFRKIVYMDADVVAYRAPDELFDLPHTFSAAPDIGWPDLFNTGVMVLSPNMGDYYAMMAMAERGVSFDGADQGLLNIYFKNNYNRLSFTYNVTPSAHYQYVPAYKHFQSSINMVHFIGSEKPWSQGREASAGGETPYHEMLGRWWAVYDRHYRIPSPTLTPTDASSSHHNQRPVPEIVQYFVKGEFQAPTITYIVPTGQPPLHWHVPIREPLPPGNSAASTTIETEPDGRREQPFSGPTRDAPAVHAEQDEHKLEPPPLDYGWDAQRQPPPMDSRPEAMNFPQMHYEMSQDPAPFVPPQRYPSPPKDMWYELPREKPAPPAEKPRPIFPWEGQQPRASRVFVDATYPSEPSVTQSTAAPSSPTAQSMVAGPPIQSLTTEHRSAPSTPIGPAIPPIQSDSWASFARANAWDDDPAIERYVESMPLFRRHKSSGSLGSQTSTRSEAGSAVIPPQHKTSASVEWQKRGSKLTDFPTAAERPSLPVTPAPIRRPKFWAGDGGGPAVGGDDNDDSRLPAADGVPKQSDWDPVARLQLLAKQQSELLLQRLGAVGASWNSDAGGMAAIDGHETPRRPLPFGSEDMVSPRHHIITPSSQVLSPQPEMPSGKGPTSIIFGKAEAERESAPPSISDPIAEPIQQTGMGAVLPEPFYDGTGLSWEGAGGFPQDPTAIPPSAEADGKVRSA